MVTEDELTGAIEPEVMSPGAKLQAGLPHSEHGMHRPKIPIDLEELKKLCAMQCTFEELAAWYKVSLRTIKSRKADDPEFAEIVENGAAFGKISVRRNLFKLMEAGNVAATIFLAKNLIGYRDMPDVMAELQAARIRKLNAAMESQSESGEDDNTITIEFVRPSLPSPEGSK